MLGALAHIVIPCSFPSSLAAFNSVEKPSTQIKNKYGDNGGDLLME
jgi:hypothetical protein